MTVDLTLGPRPDEPGPPIGGPDSYAPEVTEQLAADAAVIIARYPQPRSALLPTLEMLLRPADGPPWRVGALGCPPTDDRRQVGVRLERQRSDAIHERVRVETDRAGVALDVFNSQNIAPFGFGRLHVAPLVARFAERHAALAREQAVARTLDQLPLGGHGHAAGSGHVGRHRRGGRGGRSGVTQGGYAGQPAPEECR